MVDVYRECKKRGGCSTRSRLSDDTQTAVAQRLADLDDCDEAYWGFCRNGGTCKITTDIAHRYIPVCSCMPGFRGKQCELVNDPNIYFSRQQEQLETAALSTLVTVLIIATCIVSIALYLYRRYMKYGVPVVDSSSRPSTPAVEIRPHHRGLWGAFRRKLQMRSNERDRDGSSPIRLANIDTRSSFLAYSHNVHVRDVGMAWPQHQVRFTCNGQQSSSHSPTSVNITIASL